MTESRPPVNKSTVQINQVFCESGKESRHQEDGMYRHIYGFKFKEDATEKQINDCVAAFHKIKEDLPQIAHFSMGPNINQGRRPPRYNYIFTMDFANHADYRSYEDSPQHAALIKDYLAPIVEHMTGGMDYEVKD
jgi:hypothetical protein